MRYYNTDIKRTSSGDIALEKGDFALVSEENFIQQQVENRVGTSNPDWFYDKIGADLEDLIGEANTKETAQLGMDLIINSLTYDGMFNIEDLYVKPVPLSKEEIMYFVFINTPFDKTALGFEVVMHLSAGATIRKIQ